MQSEPIREALRGHQSPSEWHSEWHSEAIREALREAIRCTEWRVGDKEGEVSPRYEGFESADGALGSNRDRDAPLAYCTRRATFPTVATSIGCKAEGGRCGHVGREEAVARVLGFGRDERLFGQVLGFGRDERLFGQVLGFGRDERLFGQESHITLPVVQVICVCHEGAEGKLNVRPSRMMKDDEG